MTEKKITALPVADAISGSEYIEVVQDGVSKKSQPFGTINSNIAAAAAAAAAAQATANTLQSTTVPAIDGRLVDIEGKWDNQAGLANGWIDPFFRVVTLGGSLYGKARWLATAGKTIVPNSVFQGNAMRVTGTALGGPRIYLSDFGVVPGDTVTIRALVVSGVAGGTITSYARAYDAAGAATGSQTVGNSLATTGTPQLISVTLTVPAGTDFIWFYPTCANVAHDADVVAIWAYKGAAVAGPAWPTIAPSLDAGTYYGPLSDSRLNIIEPALADIEGKWDNQASKVNGWFDPFFRKFDLTSEVVLGADRWYWNGGGGGMFVGWSRVANSVFDGYALRRAANQSTVPSNGPSILLSEMGAVAGDTITVYAQFVGDGAVVNMPAKFNNGSQLAAPSNGAGGGTVVAAAAPKWLRYEVVVPASAVSLDLYPYTATADKTFDMVSLWAFRGAASAGPNWPTLPDRINAGLIADHEARIVATEQGKAKVDYAIDSYGVVSWSAQSITLDGTSFSANPRDLVFMGWGERYTPAGVSFNAVRVKTISRTVGASAKWRTLNVVVRTGATPAAAAAPVVAVGSILVRADMDSLTDVTIVLKDPVTGAVKTLTDADFSGGEYFIGVYALTDAAAPAACGEPLGTLANSLGQSYYHTSSTNNPKNGGWVATVGGSNLRLAFQHVMLTSPVEAVAFTPSNPLLLAIASGATSPVPDTVLPAFLYGVQSREMNLYFDNLYFADAAPYKHDISTAPSTIGSQQNERFTWIPSAAQASGTLTVNVHDTRTGTLLQTKVSQLRAAASNAGSGLNKKIIVIGDSLVGAGTITQTMLDIAATDVMAVTMLGTKGTAPNNHEGRGGWTVATYTTNYSDVPSGANPFWIGGVVNFAQYLTNNSIATPDWVFIHLGINDVFGQTSDASASVIADNQLTALDTLINSIKAADANVKVGLMIPTPPSSDQDAFGASYGSGQPRWRFKRNILIWARQLCAKYNGQEANRIYVVPTNTAYDTVNNASRSSAAPINSRTALTTQRQNNGVHPATEGYRQIADALWAFVKYYA